MNALAVQFIVLDPNKKPKPMMIIGPNTKNKKTKNPFDCMGVDFLPSTLQNNRAHDTNFGT